MINRGVGLEGLGWRGWRGKIVKSGGKYAHGPLHAGTRLVHDRICY